MNLGSRIKRLERAVSAPDDDIDPAVAAFIVAMPRQERQALLDVVRGRELSPERSAFLASAEERWHRIWGNS
jgi:hypothetical protein